MKRFFAFILAAVLLLGFTGCKEDEPVKEQSPSLESSESSAEKEDIPEKEEEPAPLEEAVTEGAKGSETFYLSEREKRPFITEEILGAYRWNSDGSLTFQNRNSLSTVSPEGEILSTVSIKKGELPISYELAWGGNYILAMLTEETRFSPNYGAFYFNDKGEIKILNTDLFDKDGKLIKKYPESPVIEYDFEKGEYITRIEDEEGVNAPFGVDHSNSAEKLVYFIDEHRAIIDCKYWVGVYDFQKDEGKVLHDMTGFIEKYPEAYVAYGTSGKGITSDGKYYYFANSIEGRANLGGVIWVTDGIKAKKLLSGREFSYAEFFEDFMVMMDYDENHTYIYYMEYNSNKLVKVGNFPSSATFPTVNGDFIGINIGIVVPEGRTNSFYAYNVKTKEEFTIDLGINSQVMLLGVGDVEGKPRFIYSAFERGFTDYCYRDFGESEEGVIAKHVSTESGSSFGNPSKDASSVIEYKKDGGNIFLRIVKLL